MKRIFHLLILSVLSSFSLSAWSAQEQPNIFVIFTDDVGTSNLSAYHNGVMSSETPNIDSIAEKGMLLTDYYAQPSCTAGRSVTSTNRHALRWLTWWACGFECGYPNASRNAQEHGLCDGAIW